MLEVANQHDLPFSRPPQSDDGQAVSREGVLISARAVNRWDGNIKLAQVYRQLPAVVVPVVQHDRPQERYAR